ncbi:LysR family transcriptional regulator [Adlercreutzia sp. ZJ242]|uniref:LysR family transcriptional regulator n=1 Tax=Adlercreutzia sp. ZJ242 TaxID=2709409 RepID=UPI0013EDA1F4|nr:LysR family transcriptional regulator [Adlercreutzia sp. ZJ242]
MLESWDWFVGLVEAGSFTRASDELQISQQTLSSRVAALERELGCKLVVRSTPLALTRAGETFLAYAQEQDLARSIMLRHVGEATIGGSGKLKVGISNMRGRVLMPYVIDQFHRSLPGVSVKLIEGTNEELVRLAERNEADVVVAHFDSTHPGVTTRPLYREEVVLAVHPRLLEKHTGLACDEAVPLLESEGLARLSSCPFLLETIDDISGRVARSELQSAGIKPSGLVESENLMTLLALSVAGIGGVFCPANMLDATSSLTGDLVRVRLSDAATYDISLGMPASAEPWTPAQMFEDVIGALFGESFEQG